MQGRPVPSPLGYRKERVREVTVKQLRDGVVLLDCSCGMQRQRQLACRHIYACLSRTPSTSDAGPQHHKPYEVYFGQPGSEKFTTVCKKEMEDRTEGLPVSLPLLHGPNVTVVQASANNDSEDNGEDPGLMMELDDDGDEQQEALPANDANYLSVDDIAAEVRGEASQTPRQPRWKKNTFALARDVLARMDRYVLCEEDEQSVLKQMEEICKGLMLKNHAGPRREEEERNSTSGTERRGPSQLIGFQPTNRSTQHTRLMPQGDPRRYR
jgi:hypothetical protein